MIFKKYYLGWLILQKNLNFRFQIKNLWNIKFT